MIDYYRAATKVSPLVIISRDEGRVEIKGKSIPESSLSFYYPIIDKLKEIFNGYKGRLDLNISIEYMNTSSSKCMFDLLKSMNRLLGNSLKVNWYYEDGDDDMIEAGEDFQEVLDMRFTFVSVEDVEAGIEL